MRKIIPKHCLVILFDDLTSTNIETKFSKHEMMRFEDISYELVGETRFNLRYIIFDEMINRLHVKLSLGERVVVFMPDIRKDERIALANIANRRGVPVFYIMSSQIIKDKELRVGDNLAEVVTIDNHDLNVVPKTSIFTSQDLIDAGWQGITFVGDVHGMQQSFVDAISWCKSRNHYLICAGDLLDYGHGTLDVMDLMHGIFVRGQGEMLIGNHERKIYRWLTNEAGRSSIHLSEGNKVTIEKLRKLDEVSRQKWIGRFRGIMESSKHIRTIGNLVFAHASIHPTYWEGKIWTRDIENWALFGEYAGPSTNYKNYVKHYKWVDAIPSGKIVCVGHDPRRKDAPLVIKNNNNGTIIFADTGSAKGGVLSSVDFKSDNKGNFSISNFNVF